MKLVKTIKKKKSESSVHMLVLAKQCHPACVCDCRLWKRIKEAVYIKLFFVLVKVRFYFPIIGKIIEDFSLIRPETTAGSLEY